MTPSQIVEEAMADGMSLAISPTGTIKVKGAQSSLDRWRPIMEENKNGILTVLRQAASFVSNVSCDETATASRWWRISYPNRMEVVCYCPIATHAEILKWEPDAITAVPFKPTPRQPATHLTMADETTIQAWLAQIGETEPMTIADVLDQCHIDADARKFCLESAREMNAIVDEPS